MFIQEFCLVKKNIQKKSKAKYWSERNIMKNAQFGNKCENKSQTISFLSLSLSLSPPNLRSYSFVNNVVVAGKYKQEEILKEEIIEEAMCENIQ